MYSLEWVMGMAEIGDGHQSMSSSWTKHIAGHLISLNNAT